ncbi:MAG TPA: hypothetical protein VEG27_13285, partial [Usitatibacter sp.]|nr:hypothetical protein [Usitatibacter sp.]
MKSFFFVLRHAFRWGAAALVAAMTLHGIVGRGLDWLLNIVVLAAILFAVVRAFSHVQRVRLIADRVDGATLANRHRRQIEVPFPAGEAFEMVEAAVRELPYVENVESARDSLQVRARVRRENPYLRALGARAKEREGRRRRNLVLATVKPAGNASSLTLVCEPEGGAWIDWFVVDDGTNLENAEA